MSPISEKLNQKYYKLKNLWAIITIAFLPLLISSCASIPKYDQVDGGIWEARSLVKDKKNSKSYLVNIDFLALKSGSLRIDVSTPIGVHVISLASDSKKMTYIVPQRKQYYSGPVTNQAFSELISHPIDVNLFIDVLFDREINKKSWVCKKDESGIVALCESKATGMKVEWSQRKGVEKNVMITHANFEIQLQFHSFKEKSIFKENIFQIQQPKDFKKI